MGKYYGNVGYATTVETSPGVYKDAIVDRPYYGDVVRNAFRLQGTSEVNDNLKVNNQISLLADPYAFENFHNIRYIYWMGTRWKVSSVEVQYPRIICYIGDVYNGEEAEDEEENANDGEEAEE